MRHLIALLPLLVLVAACDNAPSGIAVKTSRVVGADVATEVELQTADVTDSSLVKAMARSVGTVAERIQSGQVKPATDAGLAEFHFVATNTDQTKHWDLLTVRMPVSALKSAPKRANDADYLELVTAVTEGQGPDALTAVFDYCENPNDNPKFCRLIEAPVLDQNTSAQAASASAM